MPRELRYCRPKSQPPVTLLSYLATKFTYLSHEAWKHHLEEGHVFVNGRVHHTGDTLLEQGDLLRFAPPRSLEPAVDEEHIEILYEDASLVVCAKNGNLPVAEGGRYCENTLVGVLERRGVAAFHTADTVIRGAAVSSTEPLNGRATAEARSDDNTPVVNAAEEMRPITEVRNVSALNGKRSRESSLSLSLETSPLQAKPPSFFTVQRLDKETSGVLVLCKTSFTARAIASQLESQTSRCSAAVEAHLTCSQPASFAEKDFEAILEQSSKTVRKTYTAILCGAAPPGQVMIVVNNMGTMHSHPVFAHDPANTQLKKLKMCSESLSAQRPDNIGGGTGGVSGAQWGKVACTRVRVLASSASLNLSCVEVTLLTGRSHQIRVHCASLGYPIVGDKLYTCVTPGVTDGCVAVSDAVYLARVRDEENPYVTVENGAVEGHRMACRRHLLHATELCFEHPDVSGGPPKRFVASPTDFFLRDVRLDAAEDADSFEALLRDAFARYEQ